jgi:myo-inositol-1(or 4)-monophosphatase
MNSTEQERALRVAVAAGRAAGQVMRRNLRLPKVVNATATHDIKLELDVRCQKLIERKLLAAFPATAILGEEGVAGDADSLLRWVVDPIDGTVNFTYGIPHACVSIALQVRQAPTHDDAAFTTVVGMVYDPFCDEMWTAIRGRPARLNGRPVRVSTRSRLAEAVISVGFGKEPAALRQMLPLAGALAHRVRKVRIMGAAALGLAYVAGGRFDAYLEGGLRLWDIAAGGLLIECAGGEFWNRPQAGEHVFEIRANNGRLRSKLERYYPADDSTSKRRPSPASSGA